MLAGDVMTREVISVASDASAMQAGALMLKHQISGLPVVDSSGILLGIISEGDFLRRAELGTRRRRARWLEFLIGPGRLASEYVHACGRKATEIMTPNPYTVSEATPLTRGRAVDGAPSDQARARRMRTPVGRHREPSRSVEGARKACACDRDRCDQRHRNPRARDGRIAQAELGTAGSDQRHRA